jgi:hypothetical protein
MDNNINIELHNPITLYCPILKGSISISSDTLDSMGEFTKFILWGIGKGYKVKDLTSITELNEWLIREEIEYLVKIKFVIEEDNSYKLSQIGERYYRLLIYVQSFNEAPPKIHINCYTGKIGNSNDELILAGEREKECQTFNIRIIKQLYQNKNPENALEYFLTSFDHNDLLEEDLESLYTKVKYEKGDYYKAVKLYNLPRISQQRKVVVGRENSSKIAFVRKIVCANIIPRDTAIDNFRTVISTLKNIEAFDKELLSSKSKKLLKRAKKEQEVMHLQHDIFIEKTHGIILDENEFKGLSIEKDRNRIFEINIENDFSIQQLNLTKQIKTFQLENEHIDDCILEFNEQEVSYFHVFDYYDYFD